MNKWCMELENRPLLVLGIGIDCAKEEHKVAISDNRGYQYGKIFVIRNVMTDIEKLRTKITTIEKQIGEKIEVVVNIESSGIYHIPVYCGLNEHYNVNIYQPRQTSEEGKKNIRRQKTDKRDALTLSKIHLTQTPPMTTYSDKEMANIKKIVRVMYKLKDQRTNLKKLLRHLLHLSFPGFDRLFRDIYKAVPWAILKQVTTPKQALALGAGGLQKIINKAARGQRCKVTGKAIIELSNETIQNDIMAGGAVFSIPTIMAFIEQYDQALKEFEAEIEAYWSTVKDESMLSTFPYLKDVQAAALHVEYGGLANYSTGDKAVAFGGLENYVYQSGKSKHIDGSMTKAGSPIIRRVLWEVVSPYHRSIPHISDHIRKLEKRGKHRHIALHSGMKKLIRLLNAMERNKTPYRSDN